MQISSEERYLALDGTAFLFFCCCCWRFQRDLLIWREGRRKLCTPLRSRRRWRSVEELLWLFFFFFMDFCMERHTSYQPGGLLLSCSTVPSFVCLFVCFLEGCIVSSKWPPTLPPPLPPPCGWICFSKTTNAHQPTNQPTGYETDSLSTHCGLTH